MTDIDGIIEIHGRPYQTVAYRLNQMREKHPDWSVKTKLIQSDDDGAIFKATISDSNGNIIGTGHAEEKRAATAINRTAALENCETSAVGRALANAGYMGTDIASAEEMEEDRTERIVQYFIRYLDTARKHWDSINAFKMACREGERAEAAKILNRHVGEDDMRVLWRAPSKGSIFDTVERDKNGTGRIEDPDAHERVTHPKMS